MPLGYPPVTPLRERSEMAGRIEAIRQRLGALDAAVTSLGSVADASTVANQVTNLQRALIALSQRVSALEAALGAADTIVLAASSTVSLYDVVVPSVPNQCATADPNDPTLIHAAIGISITAGGAGSPITIQRGGPLTLPTSGLEVGRLLYAGPGGELTQDPTYVAAIIPIAVATGSTTIWVSPELALLRSTGAYIDPAELAMPVTLALMLERLAPLLDLLEGPDGFVVNIGGTLVSRVLVAGSGTGILIDNGDGVDGDPQFALENP